MSHRTPSPPMSATPTPPSKSTTPPLHLDLSSLPPLVTPAPPSNTLLITNLRDPAIFSAPALQKVRNLLDTRAPLHSFSPLKSFRRIVVSFHNTDDAINIRQLLDGSPIMGERVRIYFGEPTPIDPVDQHLHLPESGKLFFISPPPSPPHGWTMRNEDPPNKAVHAEDLANALAELRARPCARGDLVDNSTVEASEAKEGMEWRKRSGSTTVVYSPTDHGDSPTLPAVMVEDTTGGDLKDERETKIMAHTARPPVELMGEA